MIPIGRYLCFLPLLLLALPNQGIAQEQEITVLTAKIKKAKNSLSKIEAKIDAVRDKAAETGEQAQAAKEVQNSINELLAIRLEGKTKAEGLESELIQNYKLLKAYQDNYRYTTELRKGDALGDLTLKDGSKYSSAVFSGATNMGIQVTHSGGVGNVPYDQLPAELAAKFQTPPATQTSIDVPALLANKPSFTTGQDEAGDSAPLDNSPAAKRERRIAEAAEKRAAKEQQQAEIDAEIDVLDEKLKVVSETLNAQETAKLQIEREQQINKLNKRTAKSDADMARIIGPYEQKISALKIQKDALYDEIRELRKQRPR